MSAMGPFPVWKRLNPLTAGGTGPSPCLEIEAVLRSNLPAMCLISWHTTERGGSGPFTRLNLILIHIASLLSVARKRQNRSDAALLFASLLRRLFHLSAPMHFPMRPTSNLLHIEHRSQSRESQAPGGNRCFTPAQGLQRYGERINSRKCF
jgi:hypothetical protein